MWRLCVVRGRLCGVVLVGTFEEVFAAGVGLRFMLKGLNVRVYEEEIKEEEV
jgi:hypothetical protein